MSADVSPQQPLGQPTAAGLSGGARLPRLLAGMPAHGALGLPEHLAIHGTLPSVGRRKRHAAMELIEQVERAGLRGRGGGGFPTATKLRAVAERRGRSLVLLNAAEGEPASCKDRALLQALPHLVLDGCGLAARAVGAEEVILGVCESATEALDSVAGALTERTAHYGHSGQPRTRLVSVPNRFIAGQESALVNYVGGGPALPTLTPPLPAARGVHRRPTLVSNAETLAHMALIARHGGDWFRELGTHLQPGSALVTLCGCGLSDPGVYEIEYGTSLAALIEAAGGLEGELRALLIGGYGGTFIDASQIDTIALSDEQLARYGASFGAGVLVLLSTATCPVAELARLTRWLAAQSAGQCGPCVFGLDAIARTVEQLARGNPEAHALQRLDKLAHLVRNRGACGHPDGVAQLILSALEVFAAELSDHARLGPCAGCERPSELPRPRHSGGSRTARAATSSHRPMEQRRKSIAT